MAITLQERTNIEKLVVAMFNAAVGATYLADLTVAYESNGRSLAQLARTLAETSAYKALNPVFQTADEFATSFLTPYSLQANAEARAFIVAKFNAGLSKGQIAFDAAAALDAYTGTDTAITGARDIQNNKTAVSEYYSVTKGITQTNVGSLQQVISTVTKDAASVTAADAAIDSGSGSASTGTTQSLTLSTVSGKADVLTGTSGNDLFSATINGAWENGDTVDGGSGVDTLDARVTAASQTLKPTTTAVEKIEIQVDAVDAKAFTYDASLASGITDVVLKNMAAVSNSASGAAGDEVVTVTGLVKTAAVTLKGGDATTGIAATTGGDLTVVFASAAAADTQSIKLDAANVNALNLATAETVSIASQNATGSTLANLNDAAVKTLNLSGAGSIKLSSVTAGALTTIDASGMVAGTSSSGAATGGVNIGATTALTQTTTTKFIGGAGNDTVYIANVFADVTAAAKYDGGAGTDVLGIAGLTTVSVANAAIINAAKNFEGLELTNAAVTAVQLNLLNSNNFFLNDSSANIAVTGLETADSITLKGAMIGATGGASLALTGAVAGQTATLKLAGSTSLSNVVTAATDTALKLNTGISTLAIDSTGSATSTANSIFSLYAATTGTQAIDNGTVQAVTITGTKDLSILGSAAMDSAANVAAGFTGAVSVDASAFTGKLTIQGSKVATGDVIKGGTAADTISTAGGIDILTGGAGNDKFQITGAVAGDATAQITVTDFASGGDVLNIFKAASGGPALGAATFTSTAVNVTTATTLSGALDLASTSDGSTNALVKWFAFGGNTYVVVDNSAATTFAATDAVVKLTGVTTITSADVVIV